MPYLGKQPAASALVVESGSIQSAEIEDGTIEDSDISSDFKGLLSGSAVVNASSVTAASISGSITSTGSFGSLKISDAHQGDLLIQGDSSTAQLKIRPNVNNGDSELLFSRYNRANAGYIEYGHTADRMNFYAAGPALRFSLDSSGASVNQALSVGTVITAGGNISGSSTSTGSFGALTVGTATLPSLVNAIIET